MFNLLLPKVMVARTDPRRQPIKIGGGEPLDSLFDFFDRIPSHNVFDGWR